jgi:uncharacterized protein YndB with AHSA1/START domain
MATSRFVYVIHIRTTPEKLWAALTQSEFTRRYWVETSWESDWKVGSHWRAMIPDGRVADTGEVLESDPPRKLVFTWRNEFRPELKAEGYSTCTYEIAPTQGAVKLTVTHEMDRKDSKLIEAVSGGWPGLMSSLKSFLETGEPLPESLKWPKGM